MTKVGVRMFDDLQRIHGFDPNSETHSWFATYRVTVRNHIYFSSWNAVSFNLSDNNAAISC